MLEDDHITYNRNIVSRWDNNCYGWIHTEKWCLKMTISHITEILSPDDIMTATFEFTLKNHSRTHRTLMCLPLLPYMVTPITKWTSPLNSRQKTTPEHTEHLSVCCYCHIWSLRSQNGHHHWIHIEKPVQNIYNTYGLASIAIYGHSDHKTNITIEFTSKNHSEHI